MPGHERFVKTMVAGVGGIDIVLLTIAADEGIKPQTKEHLDICSLLKIKRGIVVITKKDLVDEEWLELVKEEIKEYLKGTFLEDAPIISFSAVTKEGVEELISELDKIAQQIQERPFDGIFRLPIDRVFSIKGFGTIVTGTLIDGKLSVGEEIEILPQGLKSKVRRIQRSPTANRLPTANRAMEVARTTQRCLMSHSRSDPPA